MTHLFVLALWVLDFALGYSVVRFWLRQRKARSINERFGALSSVGSYYRRGDQAPELKSTEFVEACKELDVLFPEARLLPEEKEERYPIVTTVSGCVALGYEARVWQETPETMSEGEFKQHQRSYGYMS